VSEKAIMPLDLTRQFLKISNGAVFFSVRINWTDFSPH